MQSNLERMNWIRQQLTTAFSPQQLDIVDESDQHIGHSGHQGAGHFHITLVTTHFAGQSRLNRHRMVHAALDDYLGTEIHAVTIIALTPDERKQDINKGQCS